MVPTTSNARLEETGFGPLDAAGGLESLRSWAEREDYGGYDPYDALNSPPLRALSCGTKWGRIAVMQAMRRCPVNFRPVLLVPRGHNPKALGLFLEGYARLYHHSNHSDITHRIRRLLGVLDATRTKIRDGHGWGYNFDWQSRAFFVPKGTPSIVASSFIGHALLDAWCIAREQRAIDLAQPVARFILDGLNRISDRGSFCFSYTPLDTYAVHNANLLGASFLIRLAALTCEDRCKTAALESLAYTLSCQREDGSWYYSETPGSHWVDSFHTGFVLEGIRHFLRFGEASHAKDAYNRGVQFYAEQFFLKDGTPKYYHDQVYPIDIHSPAEAVCFFSEEPGYRPLAERVLTWTLQNMRHRSGYFYFRRTRLFTNRIPYMRWSQAWMFRALTTYLTTQPQVSGPGSTGFGF